MKHHLTGAFVLAAVAAPLTAQAEGKIYGQFNISASHVDGVFADLGNNQVQQDGQSADNNGSRLGFQGEKGQFFYAVELGLDTDGGADNTANGLGSTRHAFVGVNTTVGTVVFGRTNTAYKLALQRIDPFYDTSAINFIGVGANEGGTYGTSNLANGWTDNSIAYVSPEVGGLTFNAGVYLQNAEDEDHDLAAGLDYRMGDLSVGVQFLSVGADNVDGVVSGSGQVVDTAAQFTTSYMADGWSVGASYELVDLRPIDDERGYVFVGGTFDVSEAITLAGSYGMVDQGGGEGDSFTVGAFVDLIEEFEVYGLYSTSSLDNASANESDVISFGVKYGFEI